MSSKQLTWTWVCEVPKKNLPIHRLTGIEVSNHPLKQSVLTVIPGPISKEKNVKIKSDPLQEVVDPLSALAAESDWDDYDIEKNVIKTDPWTEQRAYILNKYSTNKKIPMPIIVTDSQKSPVFKDTQVVSHRNRLEQLDDFDESNKEVSFYTQQEYNDAISNFSSELVQAWQQDFRVKALKIAIQCSKLLLDTSNVQFYPTKFVLITDILDVFGNLVYERLWCKAECIPQMQELPSPTTPIPESAKETCRNWFYKIASIKELVPRLYLETAVLKSYSFLDYNEFSMALLRLTKMVRGIGDPLIAIYVRCYLCRVSQCVPKTETTFMKNNFEDFITTYQQVFSVSVLKELNKQKIEMACYLNCLVPAISWIFKQHIKKLDENELDKVVEQCCKQKNKGLLLHALLNSVDKNYLARRSNFFMDNIGSCVTDYFPFHILLKTFGECLDDKNMSEPNNIINIACTLLPQITNPTEYCACVLAWIPLFVKHLSLSQVNQLLNEMINIVNKENKLFYPIIRDIIISIAKNTSNTESLFNMDKFLPLLDLLGNSDYKLSTARQILEMFSHNPQNFQTTDPVITDALMFIAKILHDSVNILTVEDEKRQIGSLISHIIRKIDFNLEIERQLAFYVEARSIFTNSDAVVVTLVHCVNKLAIETGKKVRGVHTRKTASFVHACAAYSFITIPSIRSETTRLQLYLLTAQISLSNQCYGQADACMKNALTLILDLPHKVEFDGKFKTNEQFLDEFVKNLLSTLIIFPDCPEQGILYMTRGLVNVLTQYSNDNNIFTITSLYMSVLDMLAFTAQEEYPYHMKNVDSNDVLYGSDPKFIQEINKICSVIIDQILLNLQTLGTKEEFNKQSQLAFQFFLRVVYHGDLEAKGIPLLAQQLWLLARKHGCIDSKLSSNTIKFIKNKAKLYDSSSAFAVFASQLN